MNLKKAIDIARARNGMVSAAELQRRTGIAVSTLRRINIGKTPNLSVITKIAEALNMKTSELIALAEEESK